MSESKCKACFNFVERKKYLLREICICRAREQKTIKSVQHEI